MANTRKRNYGLGGGWIYYIMVKCKFPGRQYKSFWDNINNRLGVGNNSPVASLDLTGNIKIADGSQGNGRVLTSDASGMASWQDVPKGITGTGATGYISFWSGANSLSANTNLFWDNVNNRLGIGISSPDAVVDIEGILKLLTAPRVPVKH